MIFQLLNTDILVGDNEKPTKLYVNWDNNQVRYITTDQDNTNHKCFVLTKHPEKLTDEERHRVLEYCLGTFEKDEIVNYNDLFLQSEFIEECNTFDNYTLTEEWLNL